MRTRTWSILLTSSMTPRMGAIWGKDVARVDFEKGSTIAIEKMSLKDLCRIPLLVLSYLFWTLFFPPERDQGCIERIQRKTSVELQLRAHSPELAAGLASESKN